MEVAVGGETQSRKSEEEEEMSTGPKSPHVFEKSFCEKAGLCMALPAMLIETGLPSEGGMGRAEG